MNIKKLQIKVLNNGKTFTGRVIKSKNKTVSEKSGFSTREEAEAWANETKAEIIAAVLNKVDYCQYLHKKKKEEEKLFNDWLAQQSLQSMALCIVMDDNYANKVKPILKDKIQAMYSEILLQITKQYMSSSVSQKEFNHEFNIAVAEVNKLIGKTWNQRMDKAIAGSLDSLGHDITKDSLNRAKDILNIGLLAKNNKD